MRPSVPGAIDGKGPRHDRVAPRATAPHELAGALGLFPPTEEQAAVIAAPPGPLVVIAGAGAGKTETMAARVVWLVANGYAEPGQVLGLTFTRKAAGQLLRRVRSRLARLGGTGLGATGAGPAANRRAPRWSAPITRSPAQLLREYGLLAGRGDRPSNPTPGCSARPSCGSWPSTWSTDTAGSCVPTRTPAAVTAMVLRLSGQLAEHLVDTGQLRDTHVELERLVHTLPAGPYQRDRGPSQWLLRHAGHPDRARRTGAAARRVAGADARGEGDGLRRPDGLGGTACRDLPAGRCGQLRSRYRVVLLDEYQDTGHAQRVALSSLFGGGVDDELALTAVGDPIQSIYGWRGASATNLPRFTTDFPLSDGSPAPVLELRTSWRNPPSTLHIANAISAEARRRSVAVHALRPRPDAAPGTVRCALLADVQAERDWVADHLHRALPAGRADGVAPPTAAVLVRRNADAAPIAAALRARGVPVEVVGLAGLLSIPEVAERGGDAAPGRRPHGRRGGDASADRSAVAPGWPRYRRAVASRSRPWTAGARAARRPRPRQIAMSAGPANLEADAACLADAIDDPGPAASYSVDGISAHHRVGRRAERACAAISAIRYPTWSPRCDACWESTAKSAPRRRPPGLGRHRAPRRLRRRRRRLRGTNTRDGFAAPRSWVCWPTWTRPRSSKTAWRLPSWSSRGIGCRC